MKQFKTPELTVIRLSNEDVIYCSGTCKGHTCDSYTCNDCAECTGAWECYSVMCNSYYCRPYNLA